MFSSYSEMNYRRQSVTILAILTASKLKCGNIRAERMSCVYTRSAHAIKQLVYYVFTYLMLPIVPIIRFNV